MEVFIREKNCATCPFANKEKPNFICGDAIANDIGLKTNFSVCKLNYFANEESCPLKSLDQHDAEVKKQVVEELREWYYKKLLEVRQKDKIQSEDKGSEEEMARLYALFLGRYNILGDLKKKLSEMKGEKDEQTTIN